MEMFVGIRAQVFEGGIRAVELTWRTDNGLDGLSAYEAQSPAIHISSPPQSPRLQNELRHIQGCAPSRRAHSKDSPAQRHQLPIPLTLFHVISASSCKITRFRWPGHHPPYAILSHTWNEGDEVTFDELANGTGREKKGYQKIEFCGQQAKRDSLQYFWVDTCCINKANKAELSHAINSMFRWYRNATRCYVYLSDVSDPSSNAGDGIGPRPWESDFQKSKWFTRGWTLQELLAPSSVEFFSCEGRRLGDKRSLIQQIHVITGIPQVALHGAPLSQFNVNQRMSWVERRQTTLEEDRAYSLLGIFGVYIPTIYGEGIARASKRLIDEIDKLKKCIQDLRATDPSDDKKRIENTKGGLLEDSYRWILENSDYQKWHISQQSHLLWIKGDPGKGKTMLLCGIINELKKSITQKNLLSYFFCQATDARINNATAVLRGLLYLLVDQQPSLISHIQRKHDQAGKTLFEDANAWVALSEIFTSMLRDPTFSVAYLIIDALDECLVDLPKLLRFIAQQSTASSRIKWLISSRNWPDIEEQLERTGHKIKLSLELNMESITTAVRTYIEHKVLELAQLKKYNDMTRDAVQEHLSHNADNTFLWAALVCQNLEQIHSMDTLERLKEFPPGLDALYDRMLQQLRQSYRASLCKRILATIAIVYRPVTLHELMCLVDIPETMRGDPDAVMEIIRFCGSFLTIRDGTIYFVHQSASDFLLRQASSEVFPIGPEEIHHVIVLTSLRTLSPTLRRDIYSLYRLDYSIEQVELPDPDPLSASRYACVFWIDHVCAWISSSGNHGSHLQDGGPVERFFKEKFLYWLEALSLCRSMAEGVISIGKLEAILQARSDAPELLKLVRDARRYILYNKSVIKSYPLQAYASALLFSPSYSLIRCLFRHEEPDWIMLKPAMNHRWSACTQTLEGHCDSVFSVALSYNSDQLASGSADGTVMIWDVASSEHLQTLDGHSESVCSVAFSHDSTRLASASVDSTVMIWDTCNGDCLQTLGGHSESVLSVAFSHDSTHLASSSHDRTIMIWDIHNREYFTLEGHADSVWCIAYSHDSTQLASASGDHTVKIWDMVSGECLQTLQGHTGSVMSVAFSHDSTQLASASDDRSVKIWSVGIDRCKFTLEGHSDSVLSVAFSHDSTRLVSASEDRTIKIWDALTGTCLQRLEGHTDSVSSVALSDNSIWLVSASHDHTIKFWDWSEDKCTPIRKRHKDHISSITLSDDGTQLASASKDGIVKIWNADSGGCRHLHGSHNDSISAVVFSHDLTRLASASEDRTVKLWDLNNGNCLQTLEGHREEVWSVAFSHDSTRIASTSRDRTVKVWDVGSGECLQTLKHNGGWICSVTFSHDSTQIASANYTIRIWDTSTGKCLRILNRDERLEAVIWTLAFSHDSCQLASASERGIVKIWDVTSGNCLQTIEIGKALYNIRFNATSSHLLTDYGAIAIGTVLPLSLTLNATTTRKALYYGAGLSVDSNWITYDSENIVWIPTEFRPSRSVTSGKLCGAGAPSGNVWICHLDFENN